MSLRADPDVWLQPTVKVNGFKYYKYVVCYVYDVLCISGDPMITMKGIQGKFKLKGNKIKEPDIYLGAKMSKMTNVDGIECWAFLSDQYCAAVVSNVEPILEKKGLRLSSKYVTLLLCDYKPELDATGELNADGVQWYQELIGSLQRTVELSRIDILLKTSLMSTYLAMPTEDHSGQFLHIMGFLKDHKKLQL
eukprot:11879998-Ditylum_brightwellii.AAC.1